MMGKILKTFFTLALCALVSSCGDNGSFALNQTTTGTGGNNTALSNTATTVNLTLLVDAPQLGSGNQAGVTVTAIVKNSGNLVQKGIAVAFSANSGSLVLTQSTTDINGQAKATLTAGNDFTNRTITITAAVGNTTQSTTIDITGTAIAISGENTIVLANSTPLIATLADSAGKPISGATLTVSSTLGNTLSATSLTTDSKGQMTVTITGDNAGNDTVSIQGLGVTALHALTISGDQFQVISPAANTDIPLATNQDITVNWKRNGSPQSGKTVNFSATRGQLSATTAITDASGNASIQISSNNAGPSTITIGVSNGPSASQPVSFVASTAASIDLQTDKASIGPNDGSQATQQQAKITATIRDSNNNLVKGKIVRFSISQDNSGGSLTASTATTDALGKASTSYISSSATTAKDGVEISADVTEGATPLPTKKVTLTVAQSALFIRLGTGNLINSLTSTTYGLPYTVIVTDASGNAVANAKVSITLVPTLKNTYRKGQYYWNGIDTWILSPTRVPPLVGGISVTCDNEDSNLNGVLDNGEDFNASKKLEPGNVASTPQTVTTGVDGTAEFNVVYPKEFAQWVKVALTASRTVAGTEAQHTVQFVLPVSGADVTDKTKAPPGAVSPFGSSSSCANTL